MGVTGSKSYEDRGIIFVMTDIRPVAVDEHDA